MAIAPLDERLNQLTRESADITQRNELASVSSEPVADQLPVIPTPTEGPEGIQVAGGRIEVIQEIAKKLGKVDIRKEPQPLTKEAQTAAEIADLQKVTQNAGIGTKTEASVAGKIKKAKETAPTPEDVIAGKSEMAGMTGEKPPEVPFNMPLMDTDESVKQTMLTLAKNVETKRGTFADWKEAADAAGFGAKFIDDLTSGKLAVSPENVILASKAQVGIMEHLDGLLAKVADGSATPTELAEASQAIAFSNVIQQGVKGYQTNIAQSLAVMRMPRSSGPEVAAIMEQFGNNTDIVKFAQAYLDVKTPEGKAAMIKEMAQGTVWDKLFTVYVNGILSRPGTQIKNALSNTVFLPWRMTERGIAAGIGSLRTGLGLGDANKYELMEIPSMLASTSTAIRNGLELMSHAWTNGVPKGWTDPTKIARQQARMDLFNYRDDGSLLAAATKGMNYVTTLPGRALMSADEFFKGVNYTYELSAETTRVGIQAFDDALKAGASNADALKAQQNAIDQFLLDPPEYVASLAEVGTFTKKLEGNLSGLQNIKPDTATGFALRTQIPFVTTPVNVMAEAISRTPFGVFSKNLIVDLAKGGTKESDMAIAKIGLGSSTMFAFSQMATNGSITGSGPGDRATRKMMEDSGWQPYSFVFDMDNVDEGVRQALSQFPGMVRFGSGDYQGKIYVSYQGMEPVGALMGMAADYSDYVRYEQDDSRINAVAGGLVFGAANYMMEHPFLTGVSNIATLVGGHVPNSRENLVNILNGLAKIATTTATKAVTPLSGMITSVKEKIDPMRRDYRADPSLPAGVKGMREAMNKTMSETPGLSDNLEPQLNLFAEPKEHEFSWSPIRMRSGKSDDLRQALIQLNAAPAMPGYDVSAIDPMTGKRGDTKLTVPEYNRMLQIANNELDLQGNLRAAVEMIKADNDPKNLINYQQMIQSVANAVFTGSEKTPGAKMILLEDPEFGPGIKQRIAEKAKQLETFGKGAK